MAKLRYFPELPWYVKLGGPQVTLFGQHMGQGWDALNIVGGAAVGPRMMGEGMNATVRGNRPAGPSVGLVAGLHGPSPRTGSMDGRTPSVIGAPGAGRPTGPISLPLVNEHYVPNTQAILQRLTERALADVQANPALLKDVLSLEAYQALRSGSPRGRLEFGNGIEALVARYVREDPLLDTIITHTGQTRVGGKFVQSPDFSVVEGGFARRFDLTTPGQVAKKNVNRLGSPAIEYLLYTRPQRLVFPP